MQRPIKFRAWDKTAKEMIPADSWFFSAEFEPFVDSVARAQQAFELMQYTGLKDKNGKEIYEGDVIVLSLPTDLASTTAKVVFQRGYFGVTDNDFEFEPLFLHANLCEVIGNVWENPELLK